MKRIIIIGAIVTLALSGAMVSCYFDATRDNPNDPKAGDYIPGGGVIIDYNAIYIFAIDSHNGDLNGRLGADALCSSRRSVVNPNLPSDNVRAFISVSDADEIRDMRSNYGVPELWNIKGPSNILLAINWNYLFSPSLSHSISGADITDSIYWWSGSDTVGGWNGSSGVCAGWDDGSASDGAYGETSSLTGSWLNINTAACSNNYAILCICWNNP